MSLPTSDKISGAAAAVTDFAANQVSLLGVTVDRGQIEAIIQAAIDAICMRAWHAAQAAGKAASDAITTEAQAEAAQRAK